jgi:hypothetical protein
VAVRLRSSGPVHSVRIRLRRALRTLGTRTVAQIVGQKTVRVKVRKSLVRRGRVRLSVNARDGQNRIVTASARPRLRR